MRRKLHTVRRKNVVLIQVWWKDYQLHRIRKSNARLWAWKGPMPNAIATGKIDLRKITASQLDTYTEMVEMPRHRNTNTEKSCYACGKTGVALATPARGGQPICADCQAHANRLHNRASQATTTTIETTRVDTSTTDLSE